MKEHIPLKLILLIAVFVIMILALYTTGVYVVVSRVAGVTPEAPTSYLVAMESFPQNNFEVNLQYRLNGLKTRHQSHVISVSVFADETDPVIWAVIVLERPRPAAVMLEEPRSRYPLSRSSGPGTKIEVQGHAAPLSSTN